MSTGLRPRRRPRRWRNVPRTLVIAGVAAWSLGPIIVGILTSLSTQAEAAAAPAVWIPSRLRLDSYRALLPIPGGQEPVADVVREFAHALSSSFVISAETTLVTLTVSVLSGYAIARLDFPGRRLVLGAVVATLAIPVFALVAPLFRLMVSLRLMGTSFGLVLIYTSALAPLATWMFYSYCRDIPRGPEEAALVDGCTRPQALVRIVLPQVRPGIAALSAIVFLGAWSQFLIPLLFAPTAANKPVTVLITEFAGRYTGNEPLVAAAGVVALVPPALLALSVSRHIRGMLQGAGP